eukprot:TRINITY_DN1807_c0_g1_i1.p1 TRINITY_DN1807_c0_g1~~TRINITY_DN1807_c0_g1_i1.p1  ORF type:complete len:188 (+),score=46.13 TRINITY_DN1807_c0_g1_i1:353-916(+)
MKGVVLLCVIVLLFQGIKAQECTECPCKTCHVINKATFFQDCGTTNNWGTYPEGTSVTVYDNSCQSCGNGRLRGRVDGQDNWGFMADTDLECSSVTITDYFLENNNTTEGKIVGDGCETGDLKIKNTQSLRDNPAGLVCGYLTPGSNFHLEKCDPTATWCYGQATGAVCVNPADCHDCFGWTLCSAF